MSGRYIPLAEPIQYSGKSFDKISLSGNPFQGSDSLHQKLRQELIARSGIAFLFDGDPRQHRLSSYTIDNLKQEAYAYAVRAKYKGHVFTVTRDVRGAIQDIDRFREIFRLILNHSKDPDVQTVCQIEWGLASSALKSFMADLAVEHHNYAWAQVLVREASELVEGYMCAPEQQAMTVRGEKPVAAHIFKDTAQKYVDSLKRKREDVEIERLRDPSPVVEIVPDPQIHPASLKALHASCLATEGFEEAGHARDRITEMQFKILSHEVNPFVSFVAQKLLFEMVPASTEARFRADRVILLARGAEPEPGDRVPRRLTVLARGDVDVAKVFELYDPSLHPRLLSLVHSDEYVTAFGRFNTEIRVV